MALWAQGLAVREQAFPIEAGGIEMQVHQAIPGQPAPLPAAIDLDQVTLGVFGGFWLAHDGLRQQERAHDNDTPAA